MHTNTTEVYGGFTFISLSRSSVKRTFKISEESDALIHNIYIHTKKTSGLVLRLFIVISNNISVILWRAVYKIANLMYTKTRGSVGWACVAHLSFCFEKTWYWTFHRCFQPNCGSFGHAVLEENFFRNRPISKNNCLWRPCLLADRDKRSNLYRGPFINASYQAYLNLDKWF